MQTRYPPIPTEVLKDIRDRRKDDPEVIALLWEIWRYRRIAIKAHNLASGMHAVDETRRLMKEDLLDILKDDPAIVSHQAWKDDLLEPYRSSENRKIGQKDDG